jgi:hypothetical protein
MINKNRKIRIACFGSLLGNLVIKVRKHNIWRIIGMCKGTKMGIQSWGLPNSKNM